MSDGNGDSVVIRVEMISDVPEKAAESAAAVKALGQEVSGSTGGAASSAERLGQHLDTVNERTERIASGSAPKLTKATQPSAPLCTCPIVQSV